MQIISHRGYWKSDFEKNTADAFERSFSLGYGTETDLRDLDGEIIICHDLPTNSDTSIISFIDMLDIFNQYSTHPTLALNIKSDGLQDKIIEILQDKSVDNYFLFDMSVPDHLVSIKKGLKCYTRHSEFETTPSLYEQSDGVWLDCFLGDWIDSAVIQEHLNNGKRICIVSPELHKRDPLTAWEKYRNSAIIMNSDQVTLCTDVPEQAMEFFYG